MGRKKIKGSSAQNKKSISPAIVVGGLAALALTIYFIAGGSESTVPERPIRISPLELIETRPVLSPALFRGSTAAAYKYAREIPEVFDNQFCYCYCRMNFNHKTLLTCFTDDHAANCGICMNEAFRTYQLHKKGLSIDEIAKKIDKEFYRKPRRVNRVY